MKKRTRGPLLALAAGLFAFQGLLGHHYLHPQWVKNYAPKQQGLSANLNPDQLLAALAGFREMVAGILWVRADSFFDSGNYDAILPIIRLVTLLDSRQIDVYATGMWHIGYNFTDIENRSDRRYLPSALALGAEGSSKNPETYELFFETGWLWHHKIENTRGEQVEWWQKAAEREDMIPARKNLLASGFLRQGKPDRALDEYQRLLDEAEAELKKSNEYGNFQNRDTIERNLDTLMVRLSQRGFFRSNFQGEVGAKYDTDPPFDVGFSVKATVIESKVLQIEGTWNVLPVGTRVRVILRDADYPHAQMGTVDWDADATAVNLDPPTGITYMQDQLFVRNRRFNKRINMSADPTMYPFTKDKYILEFYYNPRLAPPHIQDKFSWNGEGMTDKNFLRTDIQPGVRLMYTSFEVSRDEILRRGEWRDKTPIRQTANFKDANRGDAGGDLIKVPGLLSQPKDKPSTQP